MNRNIKHLSYFLSICFFILLLRLLYTQIFNAASITSRPYIDERLTQVAEYLIDKGAVKKDGEVGTVDKAQLYALVKNNKLRKQIKKLDEMGSFLVEDKITVVLSKNAAMIRNPRKLRQNDFVRGRILDRNKKILAYTKDEGDLQRQYPYGAELFNVLGYSNVAYGNTRLEAAYDRFLSSPLSVPWYRRIFQSAREKRSGDDVVLTIDSQLQKAAYETLGEHRGAVVVLSVKTGEILALVSKPSFDPDQPLGKIWVKAERDQDAKLFKNRATEELYPPGSTFKVVVTAKALQTKSFDAKETLECTGRGRYGISGQHGHGEVDLTQALVKSCNVYFAEVGVRLGKDAIREIANQFGFEQQFDLAPFSDAHFYVVPSRSVAPDIKPYQKGLLAQSAIGQYEVRVTPLQMAMVVQAVANHGILMSPYLLKEIRQRADFDANDDDSQNPSELLSKPVLTFEPKQLVESMPSNVAHQLRDMMVQVVENGTGKWLKKIYYLFPSLEEKGNNYKRQDTETDITKNTKAKNPAPKSKYIASYSKRIKGQRILVAGKTGTAEVGREGEKGHSWFIAFAPADNPKFAVCVLAENAGWGATVAGPIAIEVLTAAFNLTMLDFK
ncbi:TPA: penicillin-binding protein 2 [Candidatus Poribacteria bacterium]|nr:penicillin-binding protein 2 [Candidatus Poribacteria bacterium]